MIRILSLWGLFLGAYWILQPGLNGGFIFDDWVNLNQLGQFGPVKEWDIFWRYITAGQADITGRPIAQLSFLIDANDWPADPYPFKHTNLFFHLLNGALLIWLLIRLNRLQGMNEQKAYGIAWTATALWLLHPFLLSTVFYVVQRQAILVATFSLIGLLFYVHGRSLYQQGRKGALLYLSITLPISILFATLSKANGALLPIWLILLEGLIQSKQPIHDRAWLIWRRFFLYLPSLLVLLYLIYRSADFFTPVDIRGWSPYQRWLTESRILWTYIKHLFLPSAYTSGLFYDNYSVSTQLWQPLSTLWAVLAWLLVLIGAWLYRHRWPILSFSLWFFYSAHLIESGPIPLELYFEHRNYVPALFLFWFPAFQLWNHAILSRYRHWIILFWLLLWAGLSYLRADLWAHPQEQSLIWAEKNPHSTRAQTQKALHQIQQHHYEQAIHILNQVLQSKPNSVQASLNLINAECGQYGRVQSDTLQTAEQALKKHPRVKDILYRWMEKMIEYYSTFHCQGLDFAALDRLLRAAANNPSMQIPGAQQDLFYLRSRLSLESNRPDRAFEQLKQAIEIEPRPAALLRFAALLASYHSFQYALALLDRYQDRVMQSNSVSIGQGMAYIHQWVLKKQHYWPNEINHLRQILQSDLSAQSK